VNDHNERPLVAVVDIDGVLADVRHRLHHLAARPKDWHAFFRAAPEDPVLDEGRRVVDSLAEVYPVVYLSGRPEICREDTERWLAEHELPEGPVRLRPAWDRRPGRLYKVDALEDLSADHTVAVLVDDDPLVCEAARAAGYDVLPASWMGDEEELIEAQEVDGGT
jgi:hypothetical protein